MLKIKDLKASINGELILNGIDLSLPEGKIHALMGPNGSGKSSLAKVLAGDPQYKVIGGEALYENNLKLRDLLSMNISERAREGVFLAFQYPVEIPGLNNMEFLKTAFNSICEQTGVSPLKEEDFKKFALQKAEELGVEKEFLNRSLNEGFSGGEKKQNEILQMSILSPRLAILDETDSGLDVDSLQKMAQGIKTFHGKDKSLLLITHYHRLLELIRPEVVHIMLNGRIRQSGDFSLAKKIETQGYDWIEV